MTSSLSWFEPRISLRDHVDADLPQRIEHPVPTLRSAVAGIHRRGSTNRLHSCEFFTLLNNIMRLYLLSGRVIIGGRLATQFLKI